jgi:hypothetical protein
MSRCHSSLAEEAREERRQRRESERLVWRTRSVVMLWNSRACAIADPDHAPVPPTPTAHLYHTREQAREEAVLLRVC